MAICDTCGKDMSDEVACTGDEYSGPPHDGDRPCHDCGTPPGGIHHPGCDAERCKECGGQMIGVHHEGCSVAAAIEDEEDNGCPYCDDPECSFEDGICSTRLAEDEE